ncbi:MAG: peptidoglycan editing factor PgeF [Deltaproteobacteria bacterium]|nr:MAG: peptidoglycan editing factor PgeF [Deltaproteobacteria bacterium]
MSNFPWLQSSLLVDAGFPHHGFTMREGPGVSEGEFASWNFSTSTGDSQENVEGNYQALCDQLNVERDALFCVHQVHSERLVWVQTGQMPTSTTQADGLVATHPGAVVAVKTADCVPVLLADPVSGSVAAVHAGWRGVVAGIAREALVWMLAQNPKAKPVIAIGPHISADHFQVGPEVAEQFPDHHKADPSEPGKFLVDMAGALRDQLVQAGAESERIDILGLCTLTDPNERFFSHRRYQGRTGRMLNFIQCPK